MKSALDAAAFLASFSFNRSAVHPRAITLTCIVGILICHCRCTLRTPLALISRGGCHAYLRSNIRRQCATGASFGQAHLWDHPGIQNSLHEGWQYTSLQHCAVILKVRRQGAQHAHCALPVCCAGAAQVTRQLLQRICTPNIHATE